MPPEMPEGRLMYGTRQLPLCCEAFEGRLRRLETNARVLRQFTCYLWNWWVLYFSISQRRGRWDGRSEFIWFTSSIRPNHPVVESQTSIPSALKKSLTILKLTGNWRRSEHRVVSRLSTIWLEQGTHWHKFTATNILLFGRWISGIFHALVMNGCCKSAVSSSHFCSHAC